jgi:hypothetical protein
MGLGVDRDLAIAYMWLEAASLSGENVEQARRLVSRGLEPAQMREAQIRSREWIADHHRNAVNPGLLSSSNFGR